MCGQASLSARQVGAAAACDGQLFTNTTSPQDTTARLVSAPNAHRVDTAHQRGFRHHHAVGSAQLGTTALPAATVRRPTSVAVRRCTVRRDPAARRLCRVATTAVVARHPAHTVARRSVSAGTTVCLVCGAHVRPGSIGRVQGRRRCRIVWHVRPGTSVRRGHSLAPRVVRVGTM